MCMCGTGHIVDLNAELRTIENKPMSQLEIRQIAEQRIAKLFKGARAFTDSLDPAQRMDYRESKTYDYQMITGSRKLTF